MWSCPACGEALEESLTSCWNCLSPRPVESARRGGRPAPVNNAFPAGRAEDVPDITITTTPTLETHVVRRYLGVVAGEALLSGGSIPELVEGITRDVESERGQLERLKNARRSALIDAATQAVAMGGNAIVGMAFDYALIGSTLLISCQGTAVLVEKLTALDY